jgi:ectoine utilization protein EutC
MGKRPVRILTEEELRRCVKLDGGAVRAVRDAFAALATADVAMPPVMRLDIPDRNGEVDVKTAYVPGVDSFAIKISPGFFDNPKIGLPSVTGMMVVLSAHTGLVLAVLLDNGYLTDIRTAAAGAVAAHQLARRDAKVAGVIGVGVQARLQAEALTLVRPIERLLVWGRDEAKADACAAELAERLVIEVERVESAEAVVRECDIVVTTTPARQPIVRAEWLHPGLHITAMGSDAEDKNEIFPEALARADVYVADRRSQCERQGELHHAIAAGLWPADRPVVELGDVIVHKAKGRESDEQVTLCDLTGTGVQDTAIAMLALRLAGNEGLGTLIHV